MTRDRKWSVLFFVAMMGLACTAGSFIPAARAARLDTLWTGTYGGARDDFGQSVLQTFDGGYVVAGYTSSFGAGSYDVYLLKLDADGDTVWTRTYGGPRDDRAYSIAQTSDTGYIVAGYTASFGAGSYDVYLLKLNADGDTLWTRTYGGTDDDRAHSVAQTSDTGYIVAGYTASFGAGSYDVYLLKLNAGGDTAWTDTYGGVDDDRGYSVRQTPEGAYVIAGWTWSFGAGGWDVYLVKTNPTGFTLWTRTYGGTGWDVGLSVSLTSGDGYLITGYTYSFGAGQSDVYFIKTDRDGATLVTKTYGGTRWDVGLSASEVSDGGYLITGYTHSFGAGLDDVYLIKTNQTGDTLWTATYGGLDYDRGHSAQETSDGGFIVTGLTLSYGAGDNDVYVIKTESDVGVEEEEFFQNYTGRCRFEPNPFSDRITIRYELPQPGYVKATVYNLLGQEVMSLIDEPQPAGSHAVVWDGRDSFGRRLSSGTYFLRLTTESAGHMSPNSACDETVTAKLHIVR